MRYSFAPEEPDQLPALGDAGGLNEQGIDFILHLINVLSLKMAKTTFETASGGPPVPMGLSAV